MNIRLPARIGAFACLGVALAMGLLALREPPKPASPPVISSTDLPIDPLQAGIRSCQLAGQPAGSDPGCLAVWAENRQRFLGHHAEPFDADPDPEPGKSSAAMLAPDPASTPQQEQ
jgi:conjugative transfer region protein TrbK